MGRKKRKQKGATKPTEKQKKEKAQAQGAHVTQAGQAAQVTQAAAAPTDVVRAPEVAKAPDVAPGEEIAKTPEIATAKPEAINEAAKVNAQEVIAAIVEAVASPLFDDEGRDGDANAPPHSDHRAYPRIALAVEIGLESDSHFFSGLSGDVSEGGVFVQTYRELPLGSEVEIDFDLPTGRVSTHGTVRWHRSPSESAPPGVGIAFESLADEARSLIHEFCEARAPLYYDVEHA